MDDLRSNATTYANPLATNCRDKMAIKSHDISRAENLNQLQRTRVWHCSTQQQCCQSGAVKAGRRLVDAVRGGASIAIYGDYDVDGITATAILHHTIRAVAPEARLRSYVPHRLEEGYGLSSDALRQPPLGSCSATNILAPSSYQDLPPTSSTSQRMAARSSP